MPTRWLAASTLLLLGCWALGKLPARAQTAERSLKPAEYYGVPQDPESAPASGSITPDIAAEYETRLRVTPENLSLRRQLIAYYSRAGAMSQSLGHIVWLIQHDPAGDLVGYSSAIVVPRSRASLKDNKDYQAVSAAWQEAVTKQPKNTTVLGNAAEFYAASGADPAKAEALLLQAKALEPANGVWLRRLTKLYMDTIFRDSGDPRFQAEHTDAAFNERARDVIENSTMTSGVACWGCHIGPPHATESDFLVKGAHKELRTVGGFVTADAVQRTEIKSGVRPDGLTYAHPELVSKVDPVFPLKAKIAGISGAVTLDLIVATDGRVEKADVVRGHPVFTKAAIDAAMQYLYKAPMLEGKPAKVAVRVDILFHWTN